MTQSDMFPTTTTASLSEMLAATKVQPAVSSVGKSFIKFDFKTGNFFFGRDAEEITGDEIIINTYSIQHGWTLWSNGKATKVSAPFNAAMPAQMESIGQDTPSEARCFEARLLEDDGILVFDTNSYGGRQGVDDLLNQITERAARGESEYLFPQVRLDSNSYTAKTGNVVFNPKFFITGWVNAEGEKQVTNDVASVEDNSVVKRRRA